MAYPAGLSILHDHFDRFIEEDPKKINSFGNPTNSVHFFSRKAPVL